MGASVGSTTMTASSRGSPHALRRPTTACGDPGWHNVHAPATGLPAVLLFLMVSAGYPGVRPMSFIGGRPSQPVKGRVPLRSSRREPAETAPNMTSRARRPKAPWPMRHRARTTARARRVLARGRPGLAVGPRRQRPRAITRDYAAFENSPDRASRGQSRYPFRPKYRAISGYGG